jgi:hypothetical protein
LKSEKLNSTVVLLSIILIVSFTLVSTDEALSLQYLDRDHDGVPDELDDCPQIPENYNKFQDTDGCPDIISESFKIDSDNDSIEDVLDVCPLAAETYNGFEDEDGCPDVPDYFIDIDTDFDGIPNSLDACPQFPETYNKYEDTDGCPDSILNAKSRADSDGDGIYDLVDNCPNQPETFNGIFDRDGCPDDYIPRNDIDKDGLPDEIDACPQSPETYNKFQDEDGCPDSVSDEKKSYQFLDADGDEIEDRQDTCISLPEIVNDFLDPDGCLEVVPEQSQNKHDADLDNIINEKEMLSDSTKNSSLTNNQCIGDKISVIRINSQDSMCVSLETAKKWEGYGIAKIVQKFRPTEETLIVPDEEVITQVTEPDEEVIDSQPAGEKTGEITSLSIDEVEELLAGYSTPFDDMEKNAELNGYPGPHHVLDAVQAGEIELTNEQQVQIEVLYEERRLQLIDLGTQMFDIEKEIDDAFVNRVMTEELLQEKVSQSADLYGQ